MANVVRENKTVLIAEDRTKSGFDSMRANVEATRASIERMQATFAGLIGGAAVGGFALMMKNAIDAMAKIKDLAEDAGIVPAALAKFEASARLAGMTLEDVSTAIQKMSKAIVASKDPLSTSAQALAAFGISANALKGLSLDQQFEMIARASDKFAGSAEKNAALMELFGKSGAKLQKMFAEIAAQQELQTRLTNEQIEAADRLQDEWEKLRMKQEDMQRQGASALMPYLQAITDQFIKLQGQRDGTVGFFDIVGRVMTFTATVAGNLWLAFKDMGDGIGAVSAQIAAALRGDFELVSKIGKERDATYAANEAAFEKFNAALEKKNVLAKEDLDNWDRQGKAAANFAPAVKAAAEEYQRIVGGIQAKIDAQREELNFGRKLTEAERLLYEIQNGKYDKLLPKERENVKLKAQELEALQIEARLRKNEADNFRALTEFQDEYRQSQKANLESGQQAILALRDGNEQMRIEIELLGATDDVRQAALSTLQMEIALRDVQNEGQRENIKALYETRIEYQKTRVAVEANNSLWTDISDRGSRLFVDMLSSGKNAFKTLTDELKNFGRELLAFFTKRYILQIGASMIGGTSGAALANTASTLGNGSLVGSIGNAFSSGSSLGSLGSGIYGLFGGGGGSAAGSMAWAGGGWGGADLAATAAGSSGMLGSMGSMLAAGGPYIAAALAIYALVKQFGDKGENAQSRLGFGTGIEGGGTGGYQIDGYFGKEGFQSSTMPTAFNLQLLDYFKSTGTLDKQIGGLITAQQREAITGRLNGFQGNQYAFATGDNTGTEQLSLEYLKTKYSQVFAEINTGFASSIGAFSGTSEDLLKKIGGFVTGFELVKNSIESLRATAASLTDPSGLSGLVNSLTAMRKSVTDTRDEFNAAVYDNTDMSRIAAAEDAYAKAVMNRYNTEMQLVNNLVATLRQINSERYGAAKDMAGRFASIDGNDYQGAANRAWTYASGARQSLANVSDPATRLAIVADGLKAWDDWFAANRDRIQAGADEWRKITANETAALNEQLSLQQIQLAGLQKMKDLAQQASDALLGTSLSSANPASAGIRYQLAGENIAQLQSMFAMTTGDTKIGYGQKLISAAQDRLNSAGSMYDRPSAEYQDAYNSAINIMAQVQQSAMDAAASIPSVEQSIADTMAGIREQSEILKSIDRLQEAALQEYKDTYRLGLEFAQGVQLDAFTRLQETAQAQLNAITGGLNSSDYLAQLTQGTHVRLDFIANVLESRVVGALDRLTAAVTTSTTTTTTTGSGGGGGTGSGGGGNGTEQTISIPIDLNIDGQAMEGFVVKAVIRNGSVIKREFAVT